MKTMIKAYNVPGAHLVVTTGDYLALHSYLTNIAMGFMTVANKEHNVDETVIYFNSNRTWDQILVSAAMHDLSNASHFANRIKGKKDVFATSDLFVHDDPINIISGKYPGEKKQHIRAIIIDLKVIDAACISTTKIKRLVDYAWQLQVPVIIGMDCIDYPLTPYDIKNDKWDSSLKSEFLTILENVQSLHHVLHNMDTHDIHVYKNRAFNLDIHHLEDALYV